MYLFLYQKIFSNGFISLVRNLRKYNPKIVFISNTKVGENTTNILSCYFSKFLLLINSTLDLKFKEDSYRPKYSTNLFCLKRNDSRFSKCSIPSMYFIGIACLKCFLFHVITGRH